jgi:hypothetical protein
MCNESLTREQMQADMRELNQLQAAMNALIAKMKADLALPLPGAIPATEWDEKCWNCGEPNDGDDTGRCGLCRQGVEQ